MSFEEEWGMPLAQAVAGLDEQLRVVVKGKVICCIGLIATFYYDCAIAEARERAIVAYERYRSSIGDQLVWGADPKTGRPKKLAGTGILDVRAWARRVSLADEFSFVFHGGKNKDDASPYMISALSVRYARSELSTLTFGLPLAWVAGHPAGEFTRLVVDVASILRPEHGYAGLAAIPHVNESGNSADATMMVGLVRRFRGLDYDFPYSQSIYLYEKPSIKGVNWLTILGTPWIDKLGGEGAVRAALPAEIKFHPYAGGVIIQAGPKPLFGDVNRNEPMVPYEQVARVVKPIRTQDVRVADMPGASDDDQAAWLSRFE